MLIVKRHIESDLHKKILFFCFVLFSFYSTLKSEELKFNFEGITNDKGLTHNTVYDICQDAQGFMWFATDGGLNRFDGQNIKQYYSLHTKKSLPSNSIPCIIYTSDEKLYIGTSNGLALYLPETDDFTTISHNGKPLGEIIAMQQGDTSELLICTEDNGAFRYNYKLNQFTVLNFTKERIFGMTRDREGMYWAFSRFKLLRFNKYDQIIAEYKVSADLFNSAISYVKSDSRGVLWIGTFEKGLFTFNFKNHSFSPFISSNGVGMYYIRTIEEGEDANEYWVGTEKGLYVINILTGYFTHYTQSFDYNQKTINDNAIYKIYRNKQNVFFVGTYFGGVNIAQIRHTGFNAVYPDEKTGCLLGKALGTMAKSPDGKIWIATEDAGIAIFDRKTNTFKHLFADEKKSNTISTNNVHALLMDHNVCWAGHFMGGISKININTGKAKRYKNINNNPTSLSNNFVFSLLFISPDSILVGTISGVDLFNKKNEKFSRFKEDELTDSFVYDMFTDKDGKVWICTYNRGIFVYDKKHRGLMTHYQAGDRSGLPGNSIISHCIDSKKRIWIGTRGSGLSLFNAENKTFKTWNSKDLLINDIVYGIEEDANGMLWISSNKGISRVNLQNSTTINFNIKHGIAGNQYNYKSYFKDDDGTLFFGSVTGLTWFNPSTILTQHEAPTVYFANLRIFNEIILPDSIGILKKQIDFANNLKLKHNQNSFTLEFSCINYFNEDIVYQYYLDGFDENWSPLSTKTQANYTNISPGNYSFHIRAINKIGNIVGAERILNIEILPPFWASWKAYILYFIVISGITYLLLRNYQTRQQEKVALAIEKIEKENMDLLHQHKMNFFTYISHEFKTPLTIIITSVEMLFKKSSNFNEEITEIQQTIKRSATRLLFLVNQLMEFRKIETDHAVIHVSKGNIIDFVNQIIGAYKPLVMKKNLNMNVKVNYTSTEMYFDFDKLEKILTNLITNAIKYSPQNGTIEFCLNVNSDYFNFSIKDNGKGFSESQKDKIFEVFYSEDASDLVESSGIGLALTAGLIKLLKGKIDVESEEGKGCKFTVELPSMDATDMALVYDKQVSITDITEIIEPQEKSIENTVVQVAQNKEFTLVVVEDNTDLLMLLYKEFKERYFVKCYENGQDAWDYICKKTPDIVITEVMMPIMSGNELCSKIKTDVNLCHIPVIMLTAKTSIESKLEGLQMGADVYINKPFSIEELELQLNNILTTQKTLKKRLSELAQLEGLEMPTTNHELAFIEKIFSLINENLDKSELDVQFIADHMNIGRTNLHNKVKMLMHMNTTEFINTIRLNKAKELMLNNNLTLSEIAYKVGYSDSAYFTRIFKKTTGKTPGEYRKSLGNKN